MQLSDAAVFEISNLANEATTLARGNASERAQSSALLAKISNIKSTGLSTLECMRKYAKQLVKEVAIPKDTVAEARYQHIFEKYVIGGEQVLDDFERRGLLAGTQTISWTAGVQGGYAVPLAYSAILNTALQQTDPIFSSGITGFTQTPGVTFQPQIISGFDLSEITATNVAETVQQTAGSFPTVAGRVLRNNITYRVSLGASFEAEQDVPGTMAKMATAMGIGFARKMGSDCINGSGAAGVPQGLATALTPSWTTGTGKIDLTDLTNIYFQVNRAYRTPSQKCGWLMSDSVYQRVRQAVDLNGRPLLRIADDSETILGKPVFITPSLGALGGSLNLNSTIIFGALDFFKIRLSAFSLQRAINTPSYAENGKALYIGRVRADSALFDPSNGVAPPIVSAVVTN